MLQVNSIMTKAISVEKKQNNNCMKNVYCTKNVHYTKNVQLYIVLKQCTKNVHCTEISLGYHKSTRQIYASYNTLNEKIR